MKSNLLLAVLLGTVANFLLGWLIYGIILMDYMQANTTVYEGLMAEEGPGMMAAYLVSSLSITLLLIYVLRRSAKVNARQGAITGLIVSLLIAVGYNTVFFFGYNLMTGMALLVDALAMMLMNSLTGLVIGWSLGRSRTTVNSGAKPA